MELTTAWNGTLDLGVVVVSPLPSGIHFCWQKSLISPSGFLQHQSFSLFFNNRIEELANYILGLRYSYNLGSG